MAEIKKRARLSWLDVPRVGPDVSVVRIIAMPRVSKPARG
jgi:hypothetical protein